MSDAPEETGDGPTKRTWRDVAINLAIWFLFYGGLLALLWFFPLPTLCAIAFLFLLRFLGC